MRAQLVTELGKGVGMFGDGREPGHVRAQLVTELGKGVHADENGICFLSC